MLYANNINKLTKVIAGVDMGKFNKVSLRKMLEI